MRDSKLGVCRPVGSRGSLEEYPFAGALVVDKLDKDLYTAIHRLSGRGVCSRLVLYSTRPRNGVMNFPFSCLIIAAHHPNEHSKGREVNRSYAYRIPLSAVYSVTCQSISQVLPAPNSGLYVLAPPLFISSRSAIVAYWLAPSWNLITTAIFSSPSPSLSRLTSASAIFRSPP